MMGDPFVLITLVPTSVNAVTQCRTNACDSIAYVWERLRQPVRITAV
jgi:hypothetical protein